MQNAGSPGRLLRLPEVLSRFPVSRSQWYRGVKTGQYPAAVKIGQRSAAWPEHEIDRLVREAVAASASS